MGGRAAAAWALALACAVWAVARVFGLERGFPLIPIAALAPYAAGGAALATLVALALRVRPAALVAALAAIALAITVVPRVIADRAPDRGAQAGPRLRVLTLNTRYGRVPAADLVALVRRERPDVLSLQELTPRLDRALRRRGLRRLLPARDASPRAGATGTGLYSRLPFGPPAPGAWAPASGTLRIAGAVPVEIVTVHPGAPKDRPGVADWVRQLRALPPATPRGAVRILAGDFNATLDHAELRRLMATGYDDAAAEAGQGLRATWSARDGLPGIAIDHVLADARCGVGEVKVIPIAGTDHRAVLADLVLPRTGVKGS